MALHAYIRIGDDVPGECLLKGHEDWIEVIEIQHSITSATPKIKGALLIEHQPLKIRKLIDRASPLIRGKCSEGSHIRQVTLDIMRPSEANLFCMMNVELRDVVISAVDFAATRDRHDDPSEWVSFVYNEVIWTYHTMREDGGLGSQIRSECRLRH
jgi:type VI secretion system Hcp family effector